MESHEEERVRELTDRMQISCAKGKKDDAGSFRGSLLPRENEIYVSGSSQHRKLCLMALSRSDSPFKNKLTL